MCMNVYDLSRTSRGLWTALQCAKFLRGVLQRNSLLIRSFWLSIFKMCNTNRKYTSFGSVALLYYVRPSLTFHIFDFSRTAEQNLTKFDRKDGRLPNEWFFFGPIGKNKLAALTSSSVRLHIYVPSHI